MAKRAVSGLPSKAKVGYCDYRIEVWEHAQADAANNHGETDRIRRIIRVDMFHGDRDGAQTLLHELMHAGWGMWEFGDDKKIEERFVTVMASALATLWRDNPEVFEWIGKSLTA